MNITTNKSKRDVHPVNESENIECLILGGEGSGKTLVLRRLQEYSESLLLDPKNRNISRENTVPTVGTDIQIISCSSLRSKLARSVLVSAREVGSAMSSQWSKYLSTCGALIFVIDISDFGSLATAWTLLLEMLFDPKKYLNEKPILIVLNKMDMTDLVSSQMARNILNLDQLKDRKEFKIQIISGCSLVDLDLSSHIHHWICDWV